MSENSSRYKVHLYLLILQLLFSLLPAVSKLAFKTFPPESIAFFRITGATALFLFIYLMGKKEKIKEPKHYLHFALFAFFGVAGNQYFYLQGVEKTTAINASLLIAMIPIFTFLCALLFKIEKFSLIKILGVGVALVGVLGLMNIDQFNFQDYLVGNSFLILNTLLYSIYLVISKPMFKIYKPFTIVTYTFLFASLEIIPVTISSTLSIDYLNLSFNDYIPLFVLIVGATFLPYLIVNFSLQKVDSTLIAIYTYVQPLAGSLLAILLVNEKLNNQMFFSGLLILFGLSMVSFVKKYEQIFMLILLWIKGNLTKIRY